MQVLITGASGLLGSELARALVARGDTVIALTRSPRTAVDGMRWVTWTPEDSYGLQTALDGVDAVVNLAGETIGQSWNEETRGRILNSRLETTRALVTAIGAAAKRPSVLVSASGAHYYGTAGDTPMSETSPQGRGFLADVCYEWEKAAVTAEALSVRVVRCRFGMVLAKDGGALPRLRAPLRWGIAPLLGDGRQWVSWIHVADVVQAMLTAIDRTSVQGALNLVAPLPATHAEFVGALRTLYGRSLAIRIPGALLRLALGSMASELLLAGADVRPERLLALGFEYRFGTLGTALADLA